MVSDEERGPSIEFPCGMSDAPDEGTREATAASRPDGRDSRNPLDQHLLSSRLPGLLRLARSHSARKTPAFVAASFCPRQNRERVVAGHLRLLTLVVVVASGSRARVLRLLSRSRSPAPLSLEPDATQDERQRAAAHARAALGRFDSRQWSVARACHAEGPRREG
jgi:hypothetical protein